MNTINESTPNKHIKNESSDGDSRQVDVLLGTIDATIWADEWLKTIEKHPNIPKDKGTMIGWFANAIMVGYDAGRKAGEELIVDTEPNHGSA